MTEEITEPTVNTYLEHVQKTTIERIVSHMNSVGATIINSYPMAEVQSWGVQLKESQTLNALGESIVRAIPYVTARAQAPFLLAVCEAQFGPDEAKFGGQLWTKAQQVKANADLWASLSAFVNGLRARAADRIEAATTESEVFTIESEIQTELSTFRATYGV